MQCFRGPRINMLSGQLLGGCNGGKDSIEASFFEHFPEGFQHQKNLCVDQLLRTHPLVMKSGFQDFILTSSSDLQGFWRAKHAQGKQCASLEPRIDESSTTTFTKGLLCQDNDAIIEENAFGFLSIKRFHLSEFLVSQVRQSLELASDRVVILKQHQLSKA